MDLLEIKKQHVLDYHWPSSGLILNNAVRVLYNYCKRVLVLGWDPNSMLSYCYLVNI